MLEHAHATVTLPGRVTAEREGMRYVVDEVRLSARGNFYRAYGNIKRLVDAAEA